MHRKTETSNRKEGYIRMINISSQIKSQKYNANSNVAFRNNLTSSDVKHNSDQISLNDSDRKQHKKKIVNFSLCLLQISFNYFTPQILIYLININIST